ncbi:MAG: hypothetical protein LUQ20_03775 [Candidatus Methanoperedens sp.]|jgi:hypothetical protein|nr:hypothetical protein [Candidatus Methanoperedens sp.]
MKQKIIIDWLDSDGNPDSRCVRQIEEGKILPDGTVFYSELLNKTDRKDWLNNSIKRLSECKLIFFDPDNGIDEKSGELIKKLKINDNQIICLRYKRGPARAFFIIMQKEHSDSIGKAVNNFLEKWQEHFERSQK